MLPFFDQAGYPFLMQHDLHLTPLPLYRSNHRAAEFRRLMARAEARLSTPLENAEARDELLKLIDELASFLNQSLLPGDTYALDSALHLLAAFAQPPPFDGSVVALTHHHIHLLRCEQVPPSGFRVTGWSTALQGRPVGLMSQGVGYLDGRELIVVASEGALLHEYRLIPSLGKHITVVHQQASHPDIPLELGQVGTSPSPSLQLDVLRDERPGAPSTYQLRLRLHASTPWRGVHAARHRLHHPLFDENTLYFVARTSQLMALKDALKEGCGKPYPLITLETPSPIVSLIGYRHQEEQQLLAATADGTIFAIHPGKHELSWKYDSGSSVTSVGVLEVEGQRLLVMGTPDGLVKLFHPVETERLWRLLLALLQMTEQNPAQLLASILPTESCGPEIRRTGPFGRSRTQDRPYLRLLLIDRLIGERPQSEEVLSLLRRAILHAFSAAERGSRLWQSEIIRFLSYQFHRLLHPPVVPDAPYQSQEETNPSLIMLFSTLEKLNIPAYGDARRRLERLLRRLRDDWMGPERYEHYRQTYASSLSLKALSEYNLRQDATSHLELALTAEHSEKCRGHLLHALLATWRRSLNPLNRLFSLQGVIQAVEVKPISGPHPLQAPSGWLVGLRPEGLQLHEFQPGQSAPRAGEFFPVYGGVRLASGRLSTPVCELVVVARQDRLTFFSFDCLGGDGHLYPFPAEELLWDEPISVLELLQVPSTIPDGPPQTLLAVGGADGRFQILHLQDLEQGAEGTTRYRFVPVLERFERTPVHHVAVSDWPQGPALLVGTDRALTLHKDVRFDGTRLVFALEVLELESSVTAFTVAWPPARHGAEVRPVLVIGMANGEVQAFSPAPHAEARPELCWSYRAPQVITDLVYVHDHTGGWFVAAADDGVLHLLSYGEPHHRVAVERYPYDLTTLQVPGHPQPFLMVSSPNRAVTVLEVSGEDALDMVDHVGERLSEFSPRSALRQLLGPDVDPLLYGVGVFLMRHEPYELLREFMYECRPLLYREPILARVCFRVLLERSAELLEARTEAYALVTTLLSQPETYTSVRLALLYELAERLDRLEAPEMDLLLTQINLDVPQVARAYLKLLEHLWDRTQDLAVDELLWWRGIKRLGVLEDTFDSRQLLPVIGPFARKLLHLERENVLARLRYLRDLEDSGLHLARAICDALALPHVLGDALVQRCIRQYAELLEAQSPEQIYGAIVSRRDMLSSLEAQVPLASAARDVYEDLLEAFEYNDYDQYSRFLVDAPEFLPRARLDMRENLALFNTFSEVRSRLLATAPPSAGALNTPLSRFADRVQALVAHAEVLLDFMRRWGSSSSLEQLIVAAILGRWRDRIVLPEARRLQESVELSLRDLRVLVPNDGGLAEVSTKIHNLGGRPLEGVRVALQTPNNHEYLWEGLPEWCQGPIHYGRSVEYRTEILIEENLEHVTLNFELTWQEQGHETHRQIKAQVRVEREETLSPLRNVEMFRIERPYTFDSLRGGLTRSEPGRLFVLLSEEVADREGLLVEVGESLSTGSDMHRRAVVSLDVPTLLESMPKHSPDPLPFWWMTDKLLRGLVDHKLLTSPPDRAELRADPQGVLERSLDAALDGGRELWLLLKRSQRALTAFKQHLLDPLRTFLQAVLSHNSHRVRVLMATDFNNLVQLSLAPSILAGRVESFDLDQPLPFDSPRARAEFLAQVHRFLEGVKLFPSELVRNKLLAHMGWNLGLLKRLLGGRLDALRTEPWLTWQRRDKDAQGEPDELDPFLNTLIAQANATIRQRFACLPPFHRLALCAIASAAVGVPRKELREGVILAEDINTLVRTRSNRPKRLYASHAVLLDGDVQYLQVTVGDSRDVFRIGQYRALDYGVSLSHLLAVMGMPQLLHELEMLGFVRKVTTHAGVAYTLRVPLLRRWLVHRFPFERGEELNLRRRIFDDHHIAAQVPLSAYSELYVNLNKRDKLPEFLLFLGLLEEDAKRGTSAFDQGLKRWERLIAVARRYTTWQHRPSHESLFQLVQEWAHHFGCTPRPLENEVEEGILGFSMNLTQLRIPRLSHAVVLGLTRELTPLRAERLRELLRREGMGKGSVEDDPIAGALGFVLFPLVGSHIPPRAAQFSERHREMLGDRLVPLLEQDLTSTALSEDGRREFLDLLARGGFRLSNISPYQPIGPLKGRAMDVLFVGREDEIDYIMRHPDQQVAIVGSRRIGKTSLLLKLKQELSLQLGSHARVVHIDCVDLAPNQVWRSITDALGLEPVNLEDARLHLRRQLENARHPTVLLLDEIDGLYGTATQNREEGAERLMWDLRSLATAGVLRLIVAGYVRIYERRRDPRSAFHNFTTFRRLSALSVVAARQLVRNPIAALNLEFNNDGLIDQILERTYRVPWIIQLFCNQLINRLDERLNRSKRFDRRITKDDVDGVAMQIEEELYSHLVSSRVMSSVDQILLLTMVEAGAYTFTERELQQRLENRFGPEVWDVIPFNDLPRVLENLTLTLALTMENGTYSFPLEMYPTVIRSRLGDVRPRLDRLYEGLSRRGLNE